MSLIAIAAIAALIGLALWTVGGFVGRITGAFLVLLALIQLAAGATLADVIVPLILGFTLWLAGHVLTAYKQRSWRSRLAEAIITRSPLRVMDPVNRVRTRNRAPNRSRPSAPSTRTTAAASPEPPARTAAEDFARWADELGLSDPAAPPKTARWRRLLP